MATGWSPKTGPNLASDVLTLWGMAGRLAYSESAFLAMLGDRVRGMRMLREMSRRELARRSRVSERYIAQIEAGKGNVSIVLLLRIAHAIRVSSDGA